LKQRRRLYTLASLLMVVWILAQLALQLVAQDDSDTGFVIRTVANVVQMACVVGLFGWFLVTNTNRPSAVHPDDTPPHPNHLSSSLQPTVTNVTNFDPFSATTPELVIEGRPYGRRASDADPETVKRVIQRLETNEPLIDPDAPAWAKELATAMPEEARF
jgi:hypothetical protein